MEVDHAHRADENISVRKPDWWKLMEALRALTLLEPKPATCLIFFAYPNRPVFGTAKHKSLATRSSQGWSLSEARV